MAHYRWWFRTLDSDPTGSGRAATLLVSQMGRAKLSQREPLCLVNCEAVGGDADCQCITVDEFRAGLNKRIGPPFVAFEIRQNGDGSPNQDDIDALKAMNS